MPGEQLQLIDEKLKIPGNSGINLDSSRKQELEKQLKTELKPVLRSAYYNNFNLSTAFKVLEAADRVIIGLK